MEHPNKKQRDHQAKILAELPKEERKERARLFRFVNASFIYNIGMEEWLKNHLSEDDYNEYCKLIEARKKLDQDH